MRVRLSHSVALLVGYLCACELEAPLVHVPSVRETGGTSGAAGYAGAAGAGAMPNAAGATPRLPLPDLYQEHRYDWCLPPQYDPVTAPTGKACAYSPMTVVDSPEAHRSATILLDRSWSMHEALPGSASSKWLGVRSALQLLAEEPKGFLNQLSLMVFSARDDMDVSNCIADGYIATPATVQVGPMLDISSMLAAFDAKQPVALMRPTTAALEAAILDARTNADRYLGSYPVVVLITDGFPWGCASGTELATLAALASTAYNPAADEYTRIYVIQLGADFALDDLAKAGGTDTPFVISGGDVGRQLVSILRQIFYPSCPCHRCFSVTKTDVARTAGVDIEIKFQSIYTQTLLSIPRLQSEAECAASPSGGFWVTDPGPDRNYDIGVCPCTCTAFGTNHRAEVWAYCSK